MSELRGADELIQKLKQSEKLQAPIPIQDLFPAAFMQAGTKFKTIDEMFERSGFNVKTNVDFEKIPGEKLNAFVAENTSYKTWSEMCQAAKEAWLQNKIKEIF